MKKLLLWGVPSLLLLSGVLLAGSLYGFRRLSDEALVARLTFDYVAPQTWDVTVKAGDACLPHPYRLYGDQWRVDALFLKWKPWANLFGFDALYRLERLSGRYAKIDEENRRRHRAVELARPPLLDLVALAARHRARFSPVDAVYGSSVYQHIDPAYRYALYRTQSGLITRREPRPLARREAGALVIEIDKPCG